MLDMKKNCRSRENTDMRRDVLGIFTLNLSTRKDNCFCHVAAGFVNFAGRPFKNQEYKYERIRKRH